MNMTIREIITQVDNLKPNQYSDEEKIKWLSAVESMIYNDVILTHENKENITFNGFDEDTDDNTELIAPEPYANLYVMWLFAKIDFNNAEIGRYNNSQAMFNNSYMEFQNYWNRTHMPISVPAFKL